jgi:uncharacterized membrane protein YfcA
MQSLILSLNSSLTPAYILLFLILALCIGMAKAGLGGLGLAVVPVMALIFGARESTGVILPMLIAADIMAVLYYRKSAEWKYILKILPWVAAGIITGMVVGNRVSSGQFRIVMVTVVWTMLALMVINDIRKKSATEFHGSLPFTAFMGLTGGFATMIGNSAGPVFTLYFLSMKLKKNEFIGTGAWLYLIMNTGKLPLQAFVWKNITGSSLLLGLVSLPFIAGGIFLGIYIVKLFPEKFYRYFVIVTTLVTSVLLFL